MKVLVCDESGMWVLAKRLDRGTFAWPSAADDVVRIEYREEQLALLLRGFDVEGMRARPWRRRTLSAG
jgi:transposase